MKISAIAAVMAGTALGACTVAAAFMLVEWQIAGKEHFMWPFWINAACIPVNIVGIIMNLRAIRGDA